MVHCGWLCSDGREFVGWPGLSSTQSLVRVTAQPRCDRRSDPTPRGRPVLLRQRYRGIIRGIAEWRQRCRRPVGHLWQHGRPVRLPPQHSRRPFHLPPHSPLSTDVHRQTLLNWLPPAFVPFIANRTVTCTVHSVQWLVISLCEVITNSWLSTRHVTVKPAAYFHW